MIILSNGDGFFKVKGKAIETIIAFMERVMAPDDWLLQETSRNVIKKGKIGLLGRTNEEN